MKKFGVHCTPRKLHEVPFGHLKILNHRFLCAEISLKPTLRHCNSLQIAVEIVVPETKSHLTRHSDSIRHDQGRVKIPFGNMW
jgi:hypothetical protein